MQRDDSVYLRHIMDAIGQIEIYTKAIDRFAFHQDRLIQDGVIRQTEIIGEAVKNLSKGLRDKYPTIPWQDIAGMRNQLIHEYFGVELDIVWNTVTDDLPSFKQSIEEILTDVTQNM